MGNLFRSGGGLLPSSSPRRRRVLLGALAAAGALAVAPAAHASPATYTWTGGAGSSLPGWSNGANWAGGTAPTSPGTDAFNFFAQPCTTAAPGCSSTIDGNFTAEPLTLADDQYLTIQPGTGGTLTLAPDSSGVALDASPNGSGGSVGIQVPIALTANQTWNVAGAGAPTVGVTPHPAGLSVQGITGAGDALTVNVSDGASLYLFGGASVGSLTVNGADTSDPGSGASANGQVSFYGNVNSGGGPVTVHDLLANFSAATTGPLTLDGSATVLSADQGLTTNGTLALDSQGSLAILLSTDTSKVAATASGDITVGGQLIVDPPSATYPSTACPSIPSGTMYTLLQTTMGHLTGTFTDYTGKQIPDGGVVTAPTSCTLAGSTTPISQTYAFRINYTGTAVTATAIPASSTTLTASAKSVATNQPLTLTATVTQTSGTPSGTVAFDSDSELGAAAVPGCSAVPVAADGTATCQTTALTADPGAYIFTADYTPSDPNVSGSLAYIITPVTVTTDATTTALSADHAAATTGGTVTYSAQVTPADAGPTSPTGKVAFSEGGNPIACMQSTRGQTTLSGTGAAICTVTYDAVGSHAVTATYQGDDNFDGSISSAANVTVSAAAAGPTPPATGTTPAPTVPKAGTGISTVSAPVAKPGANAVTVALRCAAGGASCTVTLRLTAVEKVKNKKGKTVKTTVVLGTRRATIAAGKSRKVKVTLTKAGRTLVATDKKLATKVSVTSTTSTGANHTAVKRITLKAAAKHKPKHPGTKRAKRAKRAKKKE